MSKQAYAFISSIEGTAVYWTKNQVRSTCSGKAIRCANLFSHLIFSRYLVEWVNWIIQILNKTDDCNISNLSYHGKCSILDNSLVIVARHFQYRVEIFFKDFIIDGPLDKSKYYAIQVEFQTRGSSHIYSFIWVINAPKLSSENIDEYTDWVDGLITADLPNPETDSSLYELVKTYQILGRSKSCRKYKNDKCRFNLGRFFTDKK